VERSTSLPRVHAKAKSAADIGAFIAVVPQLATVSLTLIHALVYRCGVAIAPHANHVTATVLRILDETSKSNGGAGSKCATESTVRQGAYDVLRCWTVMLGGQTTCSTSDLQRLVDHVIVDATPSAAVVTLQNTSVKYKKKNKGRNIAFDPTVGQDTSAQVDESEDRLILCQSALSCADALMVGALVSLSEVSYKKLVTFITNCLGDISQKRSRLSGLYEQPHNRIAVYTLFESLVRFMKFPAARPVSIGIALIARVVDWEPVLEAKLLCRKLLISLTVRSTTITRAPAADWTADPIQTSTPLTEKDAPNPIRNVHVPIVANDDLQSPNVEQTNNADEIEIDGVVTTDHNNIIMADNMTNTTNENNNVLGMVNGNGKRDHDSNSEYSSAQSTPSKSPPKRPSKSTSDLITFSFEKEVQKKNNLTESIAISTDDDEMIMGEDLAEIVADFVDLVDE